MATKSNGAHSSLETDWARAPPKVGSFWERFRNVFYNPAENSCFGRTPKRWGIVLTFYAIFYAVLAALFAICMAALFYQLDDKKPMYLLKSSLIGDSPGVTHRPIPGGGFGFIHEYSLNNVTEDHPYIKDLIETLERVKDGRWPGSKKECIDYNTDQFGYPETPCFFIKINKIYDWVPDYYDASDLPEDMSQDLQDFIKSLPASEQKQVWVSCWEEHHENNSSAGTFEYPWGRGLPGSYFPFTNQQGYRQPLVAVKIKPTVDTQFVVRCRAWAKNIIYNKSIKEFSGYTRILIKATADNGTDSTTDSSAGA